MTERQVDLVIEATKRPDTIVMYGVDQFEQQIRAVMKIDHRCLARVDGHDYPISLYHIHPAAIHLYRKAESPWDEQRTSEAC